MKNQQQTLLQKVGIKKFYPAIAWFLLVLTLIAIPGDDLPKPDNWMITIDYDKLIHIAMFGMLAFLFMYPAVKSDLTKQQKLYYFIKVALATIVWGYTTETLQKNDFHIIRGRSYDLADWLADSIGGVVALIFCWWNFIKKDKVFY